MTETLGVLPDVGACRQVDGGFELRFERRLRHAPERVWAALTTPEGLACWLAEARIEPEPGGAMELQFQQRPGPDAPENWKPPQQFNEVLTYRPFELFEHTFGGTSNSVVSWRLTPDGDGTHLTLVHRVPQSWEGDRSMVLSGWHHHMEGLEDAAGRVPHAWSWSRWRALRDAYAAELER
jgi:uncharacterized protein YndB with AHSA1/START domain